MVKRRKLLSSTWHWNLHSSRVMITMKARPARLASTIKMVCSSLLGRCGLGELM